MLPCLCGVACPLPALAQRAPTPRHQEGEAPEPALEDELAHTDEPSENEVTPPPPAPDGILPLTELARMEYAPRDRPKPLLHAQVLLIVTESGTVDAYDAQTAEFLWKLGLPGEKLLEPLVFVPVSDGSGPEAPFQVLITSRSGHWLVIEGRTGTIAREGRLDVELAITPVRGPGELLFLATPSGEVLGYDVSRRELVFRTQTGEPVRALAATASLLIVSGATQTLTALELPGGAPRWTLRGRGGFYAPAAFSKEGERVVVGDDTGELYSLDATSGKIKFRWSTGAAIRERILVEDKRMYVASYANAVFAYHVYSGDEHWRADLPGRPATPAIRVHERLLAGTLEGILVEIHPGRGFVGKRYVAPGEIVSPPSVYIAPPEHLEQPDAPDTVEPDLREEDVPADTGDSPTIREPLWFERSRVALALRSGEVLLLQHAVPLPEPQPGSESEEETEEETDRGETGVPAERPKKRPPADPPVPF